jgi:hypothetical protein
VRRLVLIAGLRERLHVARDDHPTGDADDPALLASDGA